MKNEVISRDTLKSFTSFITVKTISKLNLGHIDKSEIKILKISRWGSRTPDKREFGHFTFLFCRGRQRNVLKNYNARAEPLFCSLILLFNDVAAAVAVVVFLG